MRVNVVKGNSELAFSSLLSAQPDNKLLNYLQTNINNASVALGDAGKGFMQTVHNVYNNFNSDRVIQAGKAILHSIGVNVSPNVIYPLDQDNIATANLLMQRYIMVQPEVREMYREQTCFGFMDTYLDPDEKVENVEEHVDYGRVMDGVMTVNEDGETSITYYSNTMDEEDDLSAIEQISVLDTWDVVANMIADGIDPTDPDGNEL